MTRYTLTVPTCDNHGAKLPAKVHRHVQRTLAEKLGGYTASPATGAWLNPADGAAIVKEPIVVYTVDTSADDHVTLQALARYVGHAADQDTVYLTRQSIEVELI